MIAVKRICIGGIAIRGNGVALKCVFEQCCGRRSVTSRSNFVVFALLTGSLLVSAATAALQPDGTAFPRVIRYTSALPPHQGQTCYGLVLADENGIPTQVRALSDQYPQLCQAGVSEYSQLQLMRWAFEAADAVALRGAGRGDGAALSEPLEQERLAEQVLPPVVISRDELDALQRFVVGAGINYAEHRDETGMDELLVFPKPVVPTGAYAPVRAGVQIGELPVRPVLLLDYEVELGLVLLEDLDLRKLPPDYETFISSVAFFTANDVSDREPIILDEETGYTRGKSHPTYLPIGPWMVHGRHLRPSAHQEGEHSLEIGLQVHETQFTDELSRLETRQLSTTDAMLRGPWAIVRYLGETFRRGKNFCMRDADGQPRYLHDAQGIIPAGSIILTGTPGGTAIREPRLLKKAELFVRGGFSVEGARRTLIQDIEQTIHASAYLESGDQVENWISSLGRQRWTVVADAERRPYGIDGAGACEPGSRPQPVTPP
jgi:2-keto-4-pentenoate hydratase/2-oxohepta-3-ene-1,7-dioic acid hydratase in catechol pathway